MPASERIPQGRGLTTDEQLVHGELTVVGRIPDASNAVLYARVVTPEQSLGCVYKPVAGERPLWDFPGKTLAQREVAAYEVCQALGWELVPPTVLRDGPYGQGMCQLWIGPAPDSAPDAVRTSATTRDPAPEADQGGTVAPSAGDQGNPLESSGLLALIDADEPGPGWKAVGYAAVPDEAGGERTVLLVHADSEELRRCAVLDAVINNADRKGGHLLPLPDGRLRVIDHGVTFHTDDKLRTLLWGWAGEPLTTDAVAALERLSAELSDGTALVERLLELLDEAEVRALRKRVKALLASGRHPLPGGDWPAIPWPPV